MSLAKPVMSISRAFVFGAGLGTRLRPLTHSIPKPLIPIFQKPLITFALDHLIAAGVKSFVINTHQLTEQFNEYFGGGCYEGGEVSLIHEANLLETGGGIKNAELLLQEGPFLTYSGDLLTDVHLQTLIDEHFRRGNDVTLALRDTGLASDVGFENGRVTEIAKRKGTHDFANIAVWNPGIFARLIAHQKVSFIPVVAKWIFDGGKIGGAVLNEGQWFNIGSCADYLNVHRAILSDRWKPSYVRESSWPEQVHSTAEVAADARLVGCTVVAANCRVGPEVFLEDTILFSGAQIASRSHLSRCIVRSHQAAAGMHQEEVI